MASKNNSTTLYQNLRSEIRSGEFKPVYYLYGDEEFYLDQLLDLFTGIISPEQKDFNFDLLYGQDITPSKALAIARSFPMMAERRVLIIRNFMEISKGASADGGGHINDLIPYLESPNPSTLLVMMDTKKPPGNTNFGKKIAKNKLVGFHEFKKLPDYLIPDWINDWISTRYDKKIRPDAAQLMSQFVGNDLQLLSTEIDKVCTFVDTSDTITIEHVKKIIGSYRDYTAIELKDALLDRNLERSLYISEQILQHSKSDTGELIRLVGFFNSVFNNIWQIRRLAESGMPKSKVQAEMGIPNNWYFNKLWDDSSKFHYNDMPRIFEALLDADRSIKGFSTLDPTSILFLLIKRMIG